MAILPILQFPDSGLKEKSPPVTGVTTEVSAFIDDLLETMRASPGCIGIAAPQVGMLSRIIVVDVSGHRRGGQEENHGLLVLVNPEILARGGKQLVREGCMSVPDYTANVQRAQWILV
ncbi:MAG: peptide deformylase, partial [Candidatus Deferrimicrobiaceae bacterium]